MVIDNNLKMTTFAYCLGHIYYKTTVCFCSFTLPVCIGEARAQCKRNYLRLVEVVMWVGRRERAERESSERVFGLSVFSVQCSTD